MIPQIASTLLTVPETYRSPMPVTAVRCYPNCPQLFTYPLCPRCGLIIEREYQCFCVHCGQALDWKQFCKAIVTPALYSSGVR
jgi:hypothetical protein